MNSLNMKLQYFKKFPKTNFPKNKVPKNRVIKHKVLNFRATKVE